jgi:hypothetical protein
MTSTMLCNLPSSSVVRVYCLVRNNILSLIVRWLDNSTRSNLVRCKRWSRRQWPWDLMYWCLLLGGLVRRTTLIIMDSGLLKAIYENFKGTNWESIHVYNPQVSNLWTPKRLWIIETVDLPPVRPVGLPQRLKLFHVTPNPLTIPHRIGFETCADEVEQRKTRDEQSWHGRIRRRLFSHNWILVPLIDCCIGSLGFCRYASERELPVRFSVRTNDLAWHGFHG